jgi:hypothetical protein
MFRIEIDGRTTDRSALLDWQSQDRLGVIVTSPLGALGVSMLIQLATSAYYDARPARRNAPHYAEIFLFQFGGQYGDFSAFDITPPRKEVFLPAHPVTLVEAINDRAITHLAIPDVPAGESDFPWTEAEALLDRVRHCYAYDVKGRTASADVSITTQDEAGLEDIKLTLEPRRMLQNMTGYVEHATGSARAFSKMLAERIASRLNEVTDDDRARAGAYREALSNSGATQETYRRVPVEVALSMLASL